MPFINLKLESRGKASSRGRARVSFKGGGGRVPSSWASVIQFDTMVVKVTSLAGLESRKGSMQNRMFAPAKTQAHFKSHTPHPHLQYYCTHTLGLFTYLDLSHPNLDLENLGGYMNWVWVCGVYANCIKEQIMYRCTIHFCGREYPISSMRHSHLNTWRSCFVAQLN